MATLPASDPTRGTWLYPGEGATKAADRLGTEQLRSPRRPGEGDNLGGAVLGRRPSNRTTFRGRRPSCIFARAASHGPPKRHGVSNGHAPAAPHPSHQLSPVPQLVT